MTTSITARLTSWASKAAKVIGSFFSKKALSPSAAAVHGEAMRWWTEPAKLMALADIFEQHGHPSDAADLRARASLPQTKSPSSHDEAVRRAVASDNPDGIRNVAKAFQQSGRGATAAFLNNVADGVEAAKEVKG